MSHLSRRGSLFCSVARGCSRWILPNVKKLNQVMLWGFRTICTLISLLCFSIASMEFTNTAITGNATVSSNPGISSPVPTTTSYWKSMNSSTFRSTSLYNVSLVTAMGPQQSPQVKIFISSPVHATGTLGEAQDICKPPLSSMFPHRWKHTSSF